MALAPRILIILLLLTLLPGVSAAVTITVTNANNTGAGSLRDAITQANATGELDKIVFDIPNGPTTITLFSALPSINNPVTIAGKSDPDYAGSPVIILNGSLIGGSANGLTIFADDCLIEALAFHSFPGHGIQIFGDNNIILACYIGTPNGTTVFGNDGEGVAIESVASNNRIGAPQSGAGNLIVGHSQRGVTVVAGTGNAIRGNEIYDNGIMGIDLGRNAISGNDPDDSDTGPNNLQNFPVITFVNGQSRDIEGELVSTPNTEFDIDIFLNSSCSITGNGEGEIFLGSTTITTDAQGDADFRVRFATPVSAGDMVTATATDPGGNTSEFSSCYEILLWRTVVGIHNSGPGTLRQAILDANAAGTPSVIAFQIPNLGGPETITLNSPLPAVTAPVIIDGYSQRDAVVNTNPTSMGLNSAIMIQLNGSNVTGDGIRLEGDDSAVRGLCINRFSGTGIVIQAKRCSVTGCYIGTDISGTTALPNGVHGVMTLAIGSQNTVNYIGGGKNRDRNLISGNTTTGVVVLGRNCYVFGNLIGTDKTGTLAVPNFIGVNVGGFTDNESFIGGRYENLRNVISGNVTGVWLTRNKANVSGNYIGVDITGAVPLGNSGRGILLDGNNNVIGTGGANVIANNGSEGIDIIGGSNNKIRFNALYDNGNLGIDVPPSGTTPTPTGYQSTPTVTNIDVALDRIDYTLTSDPSTKVHVEFYLNSACDPSGWGEGEIFLGDIEPTTQPDGTVTATFLSPVDLVAGDIITATVESPTLGTSEFSLCVEAFNTPVGSNVSVDLEDPQGGPSPVTLTFDDVTIAGNSALAVNDSGPAVPGSFSVSDTFYYHITTTASYNGTIQICIQYDPATVPSPESDLVLLHYDETLIPPAYVDITSSLDELNDEICGITTSLSPFVIAVPSNPTAIDDTPQAPRDFALNPNTPNPFNPTTMITYDVPRSGVHVTLRIFDVTGALVRTLVDERQSAGKRQVLWNATDERGAAVASGVYFYRMNAPGYNSTRKMLLLK